MPPCVFFFYRYCDPRALHSFPTRRSSDLLLPVEVVIHREQRVGRGLLGARRAAGQRRGDDEHERATVRVAHKPSRSEEHTSELQSHSDLVCRLLLEKKKTQSTSVPYGRRE